MHVNAYTSRSSVPPLTFPHQMHEAKSHASPELAEHLSGFENFVTGQGQRPVVGVLAEVVDFIHHVSWHLSFEMGDGDVASLSQWANAAGVILILNDGTVRDPNGFVLVDPTTGLADSGAQVPSRAPSPGAAPMASAPVVSAPVASVTAGTAAAASVAPEAVAGGAVVGGAVVASAVVPSAVVPSAVAPVGGIATVPPVAPGADLEDEPLFPGVDNSTLLGASAAPAAPAQPVARPAAPPAAPSAPVSPGRANEASSPEEVRSPDEVLGRLSAVMACAVRADSALSGNSVGGDELRSWFPAATGGLNRDEQAFLADEAPDENALFHHAWGYEVAQVLAWTLGFVDTLPPPKEPCDVQQLTTALWEAGVHAGHRVSALRPVEQWGDEVALVTDGTGNPSVVEERIRAFAWLLEPGLDWSDVQSS